MLGNYEWFDYDDLEYITEFDFGGRLEVVEIDDSGDLFGGSVIVNPHILYTRNGVFHQVSSGDDLGYWVEDKLEKYISVFCLTHFEKGSFGQWVIETGKDGFDPCSFVVGLFQDYDGTKVERFFYQGKELDYSCDFDGGWDSKGSIVRVGWSWNKFSQYYDLRNTNIDLDSPAVLEYDFVRDDWNKLLEVA